MQQMGGSMSRVRKYFDLDSESNQCHKKEIIPEQQDNIKFKH